MNAKIQLKKTSLIDYPGRVSSVFFFSGCNLRCPWCHNRELVLGGAESCVSPEAALAHLRKRRSVLGGVVLSGGEPCLWEDLPDLICEIRKLALQVKLDTNGMFPEMLEKLFNSEVSRPDYIALDLKIAPARYRELLPPGGGNFDPTEALMRSAALIRESGISHEYRTLALPPLVGSDGFITEKDIEALAPLVDDSPWHFRPFAGGNCLDPAWDALEETASAAQARVKALLEFAHTKTQEEGLTRRHKDHGKKVEEVPQDDTGGRKEEDLTQRHKDI